MDFFKTNINRSDLLKTLMSGLIYPAVLGNIFYMIFVIKNNPGYYQNDLLINQKFWLLVYITVFYLFDFIYLYYTKPFRTYMFLLDLIFVYVLFLSFSSLHIVQNAATPTNIDWQNIIGYFWIFLVLYLVWDVIESILSEDEKEKFKWVIIWEVAFLLVIGILWIALETGYWKVADHLTSIWLVLLSFLVGFAVVLLKKELLQNEGNA